MITRIRISLAEYFLRRKLRGMKRLVELKNLNECHSIMITALESDDERGLETSRLVSFFKQHQKEVFVYLYSSKKEINKDNYSPDIKVFNKHNLTRLFTPSDPQLNQLLERELDLLIDLSMNETFPLKYIQATSKAKLKVGASKNYKIEYSDLTIDISKQESIPYLITQIKHYLTQINNHQNGF